jgi:hypothetical protein
MIELFRRFAGAGTTSSVIALTIAVVMSALFLVAVASDSAYTLRHHAGCELDQAGVPTMAWAWAMSRRRSH